MDELTNLIKQEIKRQYKSVRNFALQHGVPQSTIVTALNKGVRGTAFETVLRICDMLGIKLAMGEQSMFVEGDACDMMKTYSMLDEVGRHTVKSVLYVEKARCQGIDLPMLPEIKD